MPTHDREGEPLFSTRDTARQLGISEATLRRWVAKERVTPGTGIRAYVTRSGHYVFDQEMIDEARPRPASPIPTHIPS